ncbi:hypothetical protein RN001_005904 [Aquatica leii]|uniref:Uncharacterized protein n=1 Tax=Aquatica leii TaxID=1421715 RepID=A0AAN7SS55_9COLE|nr:hypothetical protein RN001_005904 [Aquatica leii]
MTDNLIKAKEKLKVAEFESGVNSEAETRKRKRRPNRNFIYSSDDDTEDLQNTVSRKLRFPTPPVSTPITCSKFKVIALKLAQISQRLQIIESNQANILQTLNFQHSNAISVETPAELSLPENICFPCNSLEEVKALELWLNDSSGNVTILKTQLQIVGGKDLKSITGKYQKLALKNLAVINVVKETVSKNRNSEKTVMEGEKEDDKLKWSNKISSRHRRRLVQKEASMILTEFDIEVGAVAADRYPYIGGAAAYQVLHRSTDHPENWHVHVFFVENFVSGRTSSSGFS